MGQDSDRIQDSNFYQAPHRGLGPHGHWTSRSRVRPWHRAGLLFIKSKSKARNNHTRVHLCSNGQLQASPRSAFLHVCQWTPLWLEYCNRLKTPETGNQSWVEAGYLEIIQTQLPSGPRVAHFWWTLVNRRKTTTICVQCYVLNRSLFFYVDGAKEDKEATVVVSLWKTIKLEPKLLIK